MQIALQPFQRELLSRDDEPLLICSCGVSSGKSYGASVYLAKSLIEQKRIIAGAQGYSALNRVLFSEIQKRLTEWKIEYSYNKTDKEIHVGTSGVIYGATSENPEAILGLSDIDILCIDEASYCREQLFQWGSDRLRGPKVDMPRVRLFTSPDSWNPNAQWFRDLCGANPNSIIYASALQNPYTSKKFKQDLLKRYPPGTPLYEQQILGHIADSRAANVAIDDRQFKTWRPQHNIDDLVWVGVDLAGAGRDSTVFVLIDKYGVFDIIELQHETESAIVSTMLRINRDYKVAGASYDCTGGWGRGLFEATENQVLGVTGVNFGSACDSDEKYKSLANMRCQLYMDARETVHDTEFFCNDKNIARQARVSLYTIDNRGRTIMIPKDDIKKSLNGASPDHLDALVLAIHAMRHHPYIETKQQHVSSIMSLAGF